MRLLLLLVLSFNISLAQSFSLRGKIIDSNSRQPIYGAVIFVPVDNIAYSNSEGEFEIKNLSSGKYVVRISHIGFKSTEWDITITSENITKNFELESSPIKLDEIIVNVERIDKFLKNSPYSISLADKEQIDNKNYNSLSDIISSEPGISIIKDGAWGTDVNIRGLSRNNIVTIIDGTRIETANDISARLSLINTEDVEKVEVIKGAASSVYGSGATGGIVNIVSSAPAFSNGFLMKGNFSTGFNSVNNLKTIAGTINNSGYFWSSKISGSYRKAGNVNTPRGVLKNSQFTDYSVSGSINLQPINTHLLKFNYQLFKAEDVGIPGGTPLFPENADVRYPLEKRELISAGYEIRNISALISKITLRYSHQFIYRDVENIPNIVQNIAGSSNMPPRRVRVLKIAPSADHTSDNFLAQAKLILSQSNLLTFGIDYWNRRYEGIRFRHQTIEIFDSTGTMVVNTVNRTTAEKPLPNSAFYSLGFFIQDDMDVLKDKLLLSFGARADKITVKGEETLNPLYEINNGVQNNSPSNQRIIWEETESGDLSYSSNIGAKYSITSEADLTLSLGYSFRSPSLEERFQYIDLGSLVRVGDPDLKPERGYSADFGIRYYSDALKIVSSVFYNRITDIVVEEPGIFDGRNAQLKTNIGEARLYGFDFLLNYIFYDNWTTYMNAAYVKGDDLSEDKNLPQLPPLNGIFGIKIFLTQNLASDLSATYFLAQNEIAEGEIKTPGYLFFNYSLYLKDINFAGLNLQFFAGVENIFNKAYRNHLSTIRGGMITEPGRNLYIKLITGW